MDFDDSFFDEEGDGKVIEGQQEKKCAHEDPSYTAKICHPEVHRVEMASSYNIPLASDSLTTDP